MPDVDVMMLTPPAILQPISIALGYARECLEALSTVSQHDSPDDVELSRLLQLFLFLLSKHIRVFFAHCLAAFLARSCALLFPGRKLTA